MLEWMHDESVTKFMQTDFQAKTEDDCINFISESWEDNENLHMAIVDDDDVYQGTVSLKHVTDSSAEFAITIRASAMGKGISSAAMEQMIEIGFTRLHLSEIYWCVSPENARAVRFYDKNGYQRIDSPTNLAGGGTRCLKSQLIYSIRKPRRGERFTAGTIEYESFPQSWQDRIQCKLEEKTMNVSKGMNCVIADGAKLGKNGMSAISPSANISKTAVIHDGVTIEDNVIIHDYVIIYPGVTVKEGTEIFDHCVLGKYPTSPGSTARPLKDDYSPTIIGKNCVFCPSVVVYIGTEIGEHTLLGDFCSIREDCKVGDYCIISRNVSVNYETTIGHHTKIMDNTHITGNMKIGNHVFISVLVASTNDNAMGRDGYSSEEIYGGVIEDYVTIGAAANILPKVRIGRNSIIGASALVTKDVAPNSVMMGVPARLVRTIEDK